MLSKKLLTTLFYASWAVLVVVATYAIAMSSMLGEASGDQFVSTYLAADWKPGATLSFIDQHTNLLKMPLFWLHGQLPMNYFSYAALNVLFVVLAVTLWSWLSGKLFNNRNIVTAINLMLAALLVGSIEFSVSLTMTTLRHIEYPLALLYLLMLSRIIKKNDWKIWGTATVLLALLVASDHFFIFTLGAMTAAAAGVMFFFKQISWRQVGLLVSSAGAGVIGGMVILKIGVNLGLFALYHDPLRKFTPYYNFWQELELGLQHLLQLFGGDFFGKAINSMSLRKFVLASLFILVLWGIFAAARELYGRMTVKRLAGRMVPETFVWITLVLMVGCNFGVYVLSGQATPTFENIRFLTFIPFLSITLLAFALRRRPVVLLAVATLMFFAGLSLVRHNYTETYNKRESVDTLLQLNRNTVNILREHNVRVALTTLGYSSPLWYTSHKDIDVYNIYPCNVKNPALSNSNWYKPDDTKNTALVMDRAFPEPAKGETWHECPHNTLRDIYGEPVAKLVAGMRGDKPVEIWIFDYDIRGRLQD